MMNLSEREYIHWNPLSERWEKYKWIYGHTWKAMDSYPKMQSNT